MRQFSLIHSPLAALLVSAVCTISAVNAHAGVQSIEVLADVTGDSPVDAQQKAIDYAQKRAFFLLLDKLAPEKALSIAKSLSDQQIMSNIRGYEVVQDKIDGNHYIAQYKVSVSEDMIQRLLVSDQPDAATDAATPILVIAAYTDSQQRTSLWEPENIWRSIVASSVLENGEGLLVVPYGDPVDMQTTDASTVLSYNYEQLAAMAGRYGAQEIVIAYARTVSDKNPPGLAMSLRRLGSGFDKTKDMYLEVAKEGDAPESLLAPAAQTMTEQLKEIARYYRGDQEKRIADAKTLRVRADFRRLSDWVQMQQSLAKLPRVIRLKVDKVNIQSAEATLYYEGTPEGMQQIMQANGLHITPQGDVLYLAM